MKQLLLRITMLFGILMLTSSISMAGNSANKLVKKDAINLINIAGEQRMLSQRIAKDYIYMGKKIAANKARKELKSALKEFGTNLNKISTMINDQEINNLLSFVKMSFTELQGLTKKPFSIDNAQLALDLSESMLEGSQYIVDSLKKLANIKESKVVAISGKEKMLSQRIAKYYIAYQAGIQDKNTIDQMNSAVSEFQKNLKYLMKNKDNTATINQKLANVEHLWGIVYKFYLDIQKGGLPFIVYKTTDDISKEMEEITKLYIERYQ